MEEVRRFYEGVKRIEQRKNMYVHETTFDYSTAEALENLKKYNITLDL